MNRPTLSVVVPAFRQAGTISQELVALDLWLQKHVSSHEIIIVVDGNADQTLKAIKENVHVQNLRVECFAHNQGKGVALRHGLGLATGKLVAFIDSGGDVRLDDLAIMLAEFRLHHADIVIGSKRHSLSEVSYPLVRQIYSRVYQILNRLLFRLRVRDTQVGLKMFRREVLEAVLPRVLVKQFAFDLELLVIARHLGFRRIVESPVTMRYGYTSTVGWRSVWQTLWDTLAVFYRLRILHWYDKVHPEVSSGIVAEIIHQQEATAGSPALTMKADKLEVR